MKLGQYFNQLEKIIRENPKYKELEVIMSSDDEGNSYQKLNFSPSLGNYEGGEFVSAADKKYFKQSGLEINSVCIN